MKEKDIDKRPKIDLGEHWLVELVGCDREKLKDADTVEAALLDAARKAGANVISHDAYQFEPFGASAMIFIAESHISIHTWPEHGMAAADVFTCGEEMEPEKGVRELEERLGAEEVIYKKINRGV